jgi:hypothetical protein
MADFTLEDLEHADQALREWQKRFADCDTNNPNEFRGQINAAASRVRMIETELKRTGLLPLTAQEALENVLDKRFPRARSRETVEFEGKMYQRIFTPVRFSRSRKTVTEWGKSWKLIE